MDENGGSLPISDENELYSLLKENEERFRRIVQQMPVMICVFDKQGVLVAWNRECEKVTGYPSREMVGSKKSLRKMRAGFEGPNVYEGMAVESRGRPITGEMDITCRDGSVKTIAWTNVRRKFPVPDWHFWTVAVDVTERKKAENINRAFFQISNAVNQSGNLDELYSSIHRILQTVMEVPNFHIAIYDRENDRIDFPYSCDQVEGLHTAIRNVSKTASLTGEIIRTGKPLFVNRQQILARTGAAGKEDMGTPAENWMGVPLQARDGVIGAMAIQSYSDPEFLEKADMDVFMAVSEQVALAIERKKSSDALLRTLRSMEESVLERTYELEAVNEKLRKENEERLFLQDRLIRSERLAATGQLAASIAHEVNSPLQGISSLLGALKRAGYGDAKLLRNVDLIEDAFDRIGNTVKNLMDLNRPGKEIKQPVNMNRIVENTASLIKNYLKLKKVHIETALHPALPEIQASPQQMGQVLMNLINNAVEAIVSVSRPEIPLKDRPACEGIIRIRTTAREDAVVVTVTDDGPGLNLEDMDRIFDPFFTRKKTMGMGVGLSICYGILEDHNGTIDINPEMKQGAQFIVTLPLTSGKGA